MTTKEQEIKAMVAEKCQEVLAPMYEELHDLQVQYGMREAEQQPTEQQPDPEEVEDAELAEKRKIWRKVAEEMRAKGK